MDTKQVAAKLSALLDLTVTPVAVAFRPTAPAGVPRIERAGPAGCAYWKPASEGRVFSFTIPGSALADVVQKLETIVHANGALAQYHEERRRTIGAPHA